MSSIKPAASLLIAVLYVYIFKNNQANSDRVRLHIYEILEKFLKLTRQKNTESNDGSIDEDVFVRMQKCLREGVRDRHPSAQANAIRAAYSLQSSRDPACPIIAAYLHLLSHDSDKSARLLVLDHIVINERTLDYFRTQLVFDSDVDVRNRLVKLVLNKVPTEFVDAKFKRNLIECVLFRNANHDLTERLLYKWYFLVSMCFFRIILDKNILIERLDASQSNPIVSFLSSLDLKNEWFHDSDPRCMSHMDAKLLQVMDIIYHMILSDSNDLDALISSMNAHTSSQKLLTDSTCAFYYRSLVSFVTRLKFGELLDREFATGVLQAVIDSNTNIEPLVFFNLIEALFCFENLIATTDRESLSRLVCAVRHTDGLEFLYERVIEKFEPRTRVEFVWKYYSGYIRIGYEAEHLKRLLTVFSIVMAQINQTNLDKIDQWVLELDPNALDQDDNDNDQGVVEHWVRNLLLSNIVDLDPQVRMLVARGFGIASLLNQNLWNIFSDFLINVRTFI